MTLGLASRLYSASVESARHDPDDQGTPRTAPEAWSPPESSGEVEPWPEGVGVTFDDFIRQQEEAAYGEGGFRSYGPSWATKPHRYGGAEYKRLVRVLRKTRDAIAEARLDESQCAMLADECERVIEYARSLRADDPFQTVWANRFDLTGRGSALVPPLEEILVDVAGGRARADVTFGTSYVGAGNAAHGGAIALLFDEFLGLTANAGRPVVRTAYLHVNYRNVTPMRTKLSVHAHIDRIEGRKRYVVGELRHGDTLLADAESLFVELQPWHS